MNNNLSIPTWAQMFYSMIDDRIKHLQNGGDVKEHRIDFYNVDLHGINFPEVIEARYPDLDEDIKYQIFQYGDYAFADMENCVFYGAIHRLHLLNFSYSDFSEANMKNAIFDCAYLKDCRFTLTDLTNAQMQSSTLVECYFDYTKMINVNLTNVMVEFTDFYGCDFAGANLSNTRFLATSFDAMVNCMVVILPQSITFVAVKNSDNSIFINTDSCSGLYDEVSDHFYNENSFFNLGLILKTLQYIKDSLLFYCSD